MSSYRENLFNIFMFKLNYVKRHFTHFDQPYFLKYPHIDQKNVHIIFKDQERGHNTGMMVMLQPHFGTINSVSHVFATLHTPKY